MFEAAYTICRPLGLLPRCLGACVAPLHHHVQLPAPALIAGPSTELTCTLGSLYLQSLGRGHSPLHDTLFSAFLTGISRPSGGFHLSPTESWYPLCHCVSLPPPGISSLFGC